MSLLTTEDMIEAVMVGTIKAYHIKEEEDGKLLKTGIRYTGTGKDFCLTLLLHCVKVFTRESGI